MGIQGEVALSVVFQANGAIRVIGVVKSLDTGSTRRRNRLPHRFVSSQPSATASRRIFRLPCASSSGWPTNPRNRRESYAYSSHRTRHLVSFHSCTCHPDAFALSGRDRQSPEKVEEQPEPPEMASIIDRIIANERQYNQKLKEYSPRVETYVQYYQPDAELGDVARKDASFWAA